MPESCNTTIESIGVYVPPKVVYSRDVLKNCKNRLSFPIEELTGIRSTHWAGDLEFSIDLARKAVAECLASSRYRPAAIDMLVCSNISRCDGANFRVSYEPNTAIRLKSAFGFERALAFDISNACPGMFTAIAIADRFIRAGVIRCAMVVSGEFITHLTRTAQQLVDGLRDPLLACLTLGDAGAAVILERAADTRTGFHVINLYTAGSYSSLCIAKAASHPSGGAVMYTQTTALTPVAVAHAAAHAVDTVQRHGWSLDSIQHLIPHQTARKTLVDMARVVDQMLSRPGWAESVTIDNLTERGNTATTTHFIAVMDHIRQGRINTGDRVVFSIAGSGLTVGTALFTFDDLPDRLRQRQPGLDRQRRVDALANGENSVPGPKGIGIRSVGTVPPGWDGLRTTVELARYASTQCLARSPLDKSAVELLIFFGVYQSDFVIEPSTAALVAGALELNTRIKSQRDPKTLAFDLHSSGRGFLDACYVALQMIQGNSGGNALVVASEVENNQPGCPAKPVGVEQTGSAVLLGRTADARRGFGNFVFADYPDYLDDYETYVGQQEGLTFVRCRASERFEDHLLQAIAETVHKLMACEQLALSQIRWILAPQRSPEFITALSRQLAVDRAKFVDISRPHKDLFTSSLAYGFQYLVDHQKRQPGDIGLLISAGAGIQVGCATYYF